MAKKRSTEAAKKPAGDPWEGVGWEDVEAWAGDGARSRGWRYQQEGRVRDLRVTEGDDLVAWVEGGHRYATLVSLTRGRGAAASRLRSTCTCPVGEACKHAVAVVLARAEHGRQGTPLPKADFDDPRLSDLAQEDEEEEEVEDERPPAKRHSNSGVSKGRAAWEAGARARLESLATGELVDLLVRVASSSRDARRALEDDLDAKEGRHDRLVKAARDQLRSLTDQEVWVNSWTGEGRVPNYGPLKERFQKLLDLGEHEAVVTLGVELLRRGEEQVSSSHDEGETAQQIANCLGPVVEALLASARTDAEKVLFAIDALLRTDFELAHEFERVPQRKWTKATWSEVADGLLARLAAAPAASADTFRGWSEQYARAKLSDWAILALDHAGRGDEATELCVAEAARGGESVRAVKRLLEMKQVERAEAVASEGLRNIDPKLAGVVAELQDALCRIAALRKDWKLIAAVMAERFFDRPDVGSLLVLEKAAKRAKVGAQVAEAARRFLETGERPSRGGAADGWPLPEPPRAERVDSASRRHSRGAGPHFGVLIELAIAEKRPDDALRWRDASEAAGRSLRFDHREDVRVADAVTESHPDRAVELYLTAADAIAAQTSVSTYPDTVKLLCKAKAVVASQDRLEFWPDLLAEFRERHHRKRRLMELIDAAERRRG